MARIPSRCHSSNWEGLNLSRMFGAWVISRFTDDGDDASGSSASSSNRCLNSVGTWFTALLAPAKNSPMAVCSTAINLLAIMSRRPRYAGSSAVSEVDAES